MGYDIMRETVDALRLSPELLAVAVRYLSPEQARWQPAAGEWSVLEVICHLRDVEEVSYNRFRAIRDTDNAVVAGADANKLARERNYMGDVVGELDATAAKARKAAAYQAWWEHLPVRLDAPDGSELAVYQAFDVGDLARLYVLDQRQYSDVPPCRDDPGAQSDFGDCAARTDDADRTRLGAEQEAWFADQAAASRATWNLVGNPVVLAGVDGGNAADGSKYYLDTWDGFPTARHRFIEQLAAVENPVVLTGDYHAGMVLDVHERPFDGDGGAIVATELMSPAISSPLFPDDVSDRTPQLRQQLNEHGYLTVTVEPEQVTAQFRVLADVADPASAISTAATWVIQAGNPRAEPA